MKNIALLLFIISLSSCTAQKKASLTSINYLAQTRGFLVDLTFVRSALPGEELFPGQTRDKSASMCFNRDYYKYGESTTGERTSGRDLARPLFLDVFQEGMTNGS